MTQLNEAELFGEQAQMGGSTLLPGKLLYLMNLDLLSFTGSKNTGTPGAEIQLTVASGPFQGEEITTTLWLTPGGEGKTGKFISWVNHVIRAITGKYPNFAAATGMGFQVQQDRASNQQAFCDWFNTLDEAQKLDLMKQYAHISEWNGKQVVVKLDVERDAITDPDTGEAKYDEATGEPLYFSRNRVAAVYPPSDPKFGKAYVERVMHARHEQAQDNIPF